MTVYGLVHGAWHGAWCWELLIPELAARGHRAVAVHLPAEDPAAGAAEYSAAVIAALDSSGEAAPLHREAVRSRTGAAPLHREAVQRRSRGEDIVLVGHSLGGLTVPLVAAARPVRHVVYLAALLPDPGRSVDEQAAAGDRQTRRGLGRGQVVHPDGSSSWRPDAAASTLFPDSPPEVARAATARLRRQHWTPTREITPLRAWPDVPSTYVLCANDLVIDPDWASRAAAQRLGVDPIVLPGDHAPFLARPAELADLLTGLR